MGSKGERVHHCRNSQPGEKSHSTYFVLSRKKVMFIQNEASVDAGKYEEAFSSSSHTGLTSSVIPKVQTPSERVNSHTGVSTRNALGKAEHTYALHPSMVVKRKRMSILLSTMVQLSFQLLPRRNSSTARRNS